MSVVALALGILIVMPTVSAQLQRVLADVTPIRGGERVQAGQEVRVGVLVRLPDGFHVQSNQPRDPSLIPTALTVEAPDGVTVREIVFPRPVDLAQRGAPEPLAVFEQQFTIGVRLHLDEHIAPGDITVPARLRYQTCDDATCFPPTSTVVSWTFSVTGQPVATSTLPTELEGVAWGSGTAAPPSAAPERPHDRATAAGDDALMQLARFDLLATTGGYLDSEDFLTFVRNAEQGIREQGWFDGRGPLAILVIVFLGGLALNLTPCVLPMIPINLAIIGAGVRSGSRARGLLLGATYGAAMAVVYGVLGVVVVMTAGTFGTINASPWFNVAIAVLFVVLSLAMFDVITIDFSRWSTRFSSQAGQGSFVLAFTMGAVAALLAGACVAPVVIQVVLFSSSLYNAGSTAALALPFLLGVGMALPWPIAGAGLAALPKPGAWMVRVKQGFGAVILGTAVYYGYLGYGLFADRWVDASSVTSSVADKVKAGWYSSLAEGLAVAERERKPVLIDMWATWCKNCLTMDKTTFEDRAVVSALSGYVKVKFQAEQPDENPAKAVMERFHAVGLPTYVLLKPTRTSAVLVADPVARP